MQKDTDFDEEASGHQSFSCSQRQRDTEGRGDRTRVSFATARMILFFILFSMQIETSPRSPNLAVLAQSFAEPCPRRGSGWAELTPPSQLEQGMCLILPKKQLKWNFLGSDFEQVFSRAPTLP